MAYQISGTYQKTDFIRLARAAQYQSKPVRQKRIFSKVSATAVGGLFLLFGVATLIPFIQAGVKGERFLSLPFLLVPIGLLINGIALMLNYSYKQLGRVMWKHYSDKGASFRYHFTSEGFTQEIGGDCRQYDYSVIQNSYEDRVAYYLFWDKFSAYIIHKAGFTAGDPASFAAFIQEQTGKAVQPLD